MFNNIFKSKKNYPEFFRTYLDSFKKSKNLPLSETRFIVFDTETTGFDKHEDRILSIGAVSVVNNMINVVDNFELYIHQEIFKSESVKIHGLLKEGHIEKVTEVEAIELFIKFIKNDVLVGHHVGFDINMVDQMLLRNNLGKLKNECLDTGLLFKQSKHIVYQQNLKNYTLDDLCDELKIEKVDRHTATGDALITAIAFQKIVARLDKKNNLKLKDLL
ncbi:3'-5' exonuclease [Aureibaculum sp. A20]|uniref:3'-5' exonuclease n=1 Tax=Aureibaculum flavum TaxID=2795986 RepID=A0ABS0WMY8_9FLAO|nr:3'-5' exonuclease [Aureibaculum flavum]MBJ2173335.1 3'-5' exonuclease [Aureibaculum flavum]